MVFADGSAAAGRGDAKRAGSDARRRAVRESAARARHDGVRCGDAGRWLVGARLRVSPLFGPCIDRRAAMQLLQEEHGLCHSLPSTRTIPHRFALISVQTTRNSGWRRKNVRFPLAFGATGRLRARLHIDGTARLSTVQAAKRAAGVKVYLFTYVYVVAVNKGGPNLCKTSVYANGSTPWRMHNRMRTVCGDQGFQG
jgi:hypothetical protein